MSDELTLKGWQQENAELHDEIEELRQENDRLKADSERLNVLLERSILSFENGKTRLVGPDIDDTTLDYRRYLDALNEKTPNPRTEG